MKISIAMATYNGAPYINEQLDSFARQVRCPEELVVTDDASTDETMAIIDRFAQSAPFEVKIFRNRQTLGYSANFENAIERCSGDIIFLSDQDDVWFPEKIETIERIFAEGGDIFVTVNDAEIATEDLRSTQFSKSKQIEALGLRQEDFVTGCCSAFRSAMIPLICPVPDSGLGHDGWLHKLGNYLGVRQVVPQILQQHRRHGDTTSRWLGSSARRVRPSDVFKTYAPENPRPWCQQRLEQLDHLENRISERVEQITGLSEPDRRQKSAIDRIHRTRKAVIHRVNLLEKDRLRRLPLASKMLLGGDYNHFSGWKSFLKDVLVR